MISTALNFRLNFHFMCVCKICFFCIFRYVILRWIHLIPIYYSHEFYRLYNFYALFLNKENLCAAKFSSYTNYEYIDTFDQKKKKMKKSEAHKAKKKKHNNIYIPQNNVWQPNSNIRKRWMSNARYVHSKSTKERYI